MKNKIVLFVVGILFAVILIPFSPISQAEMAPERTVEPGDSIQEAINNASAGETILITSGIYDEKRIYVNKSITLAGENAETTIIDAGGQEPTIFTVSSEGVKIKNLTLQNTTKTGLVGAILIRSVRNVETLECIIISCGMGIQLENSTYCSVARNQIVDNYSHGVHLKGNSSYNLIVGNTIKNNSIGIYIDDVECRKNLLYHNNFVNNREEQQAGRGNTANNWNNTYPFGGNYWSDYYDVDIMNGPNQDYHGSDGIGDANYTIYPDPTGATVDYYPLMAPVHFFDAGQWDTQDYCVAVASNLNVSNFNFNPDEEPPFIQFDLTGQNGDFCRVTIPQQLLWVGDPAEWQVLLSGSTASTLILEDDNYTYIYFNFTHDGSAQTAKILGTFAIPEFPKPIILVLTLATLLAVIIARKRDRPSVADSCFSKDA